MDQLLYTIPQTLPDGVDTRAAMPPNETRTLCYHFATQLGSTARDGPEQRAMLELNCVDKSVLVGTEHNRERQARPNFECCVPR
jgi:hypothetical protein